MGDPPRPERMRLCFKFCGDESRPLSYSKPPASKPFGYGGLVLKCGRCCLSTFLKVDLTIARTQDHPVATTGSVTVSFKVFR